jgi:3-methyladenine DNA glycosylase AlkD
MILLEKKSKKAGVQTAELIEQLIVTKSWWDTVDALAAIHAGALFSRYPELVKLYIPRWMKSGNMWLQRSAILFQLKYKKNTDETLLFDCMRQLSGSREFFIRKAIGWALREYGKTNPAAVMDFVARQPLSPLSYREATRRIMKKTD